MQAEAGPLRDEEMIACQPAPVLATQKKKQTALNTTDIGSISIRYVT